MCRFSFRSLLAILRGGDGFCDGRGGCRRALAREHRQSRNAHLYAAADDADGAEAGAPDGAHHDAARAPRRRRDRRASVTGAQPGGLFNRPGLIGGLSAGFLGAGLIGLLLGHGFLGGLGGLASIFGLLLQVGLIAIVAMLAWRWWQRRSQPAPPWQRTVAARYPSEPTRPRLGLGALGRPRRRCSFRTAGRRRGRHHARRLRRLRAAARRDPDRLWRRGSRQAARARHAGNALLFLRRSCRRMRAAASSTGSPT